MKLLTKLLTLSSHEFKEAQRLKPNIHTQVIIIFSSPLPPPCIYAMSYVIPTFTNT